MSINFSNYIKSTSSQAVGLVPTAIKTSNGYTANANDLVRCDTTAGSFSITFPASPADGAVIGIVDVAGTFGSNMLVINRGGTTTIELDTQYNLDINGAYVTFIYNVTGTNWRLLETPSAPATSTAGRGIAFGIVMGF